MTNFDWLLINNMILKQIWTRNVFTVKVANMSLSALNDLRSRLQSIIEQMHTRHVRH